MATAQPLCVRSNRGVPLGFCVASIAGGIALMAIWPWWGPAIGAALVVWAVATLRSAVWISDEGVSVRNPVRRRTWNWEQIDEVVMTQGMPLLAISPMFSLLAVRTKDGGTFPLYSTTALSSTRAREVIDALAAHDCPLGEYVDASVFPMGLFRSVEAAQRAKERRDQEAWAADQAARKSPDYDGRHL